MVQIDARIRGREAALGKYQAIVSPAALLPVEACNLWTQELHANGVQALIAHPEFRYAIQLPTISVEFGLAKEDGCRAGFKITGSARPICRGDHHHDVDAFLAKPAVVATNKFQGRPAMILQVDDQKIRPLRQRIFQNAGQTLKADRAIAEVTNCRAAVFSKHPHEETCRMAVVIDQPNEG